MDKYKVISFEEYRKQKAWMLIKKASLKTYYP